MKKTGGGLSPVQWLALGVGAAALAFFGAPALINYFNQQDAPAPLGSTVQVTDASIETCDNPAAPLPGVKNCKGEVDLKFTQVPSSGWVSVFFEFPPNSGGMFHGQAAVKSVGEVPVDVVNDYEARCVSGKAQLQINIYDGPESPAPTKLIESVGASLPAQDCSNFPRGGL